MDRIKKIIVILLILILITVLIIFIWSNVAKKEMNNVNERLQEQGNKEDNVDKDLVEVKSSDIYYMIKRNVDLYISYMKQINGIIGEITYQDQNVSDDGINKLYDLLDDEYKEQFNVTKNNLADKIKRYESYDLDIRMMYKVEFTDKIFLYIIEATLDREEFNVFIKIDNENATFSIYPQEYIDKNFDEITTDSIQIKINKNNIPKNSYNGIRYSKISDDYLALQYINTLKKRILNDPEYAYTLMEEEYKQKRFGSLENFKKYVNNNRAEIEQIETESYLKNTYQDYTEFICKDQFNNIYSFKDRGIMNYIVELDDYTLDYQDEEYLNEYNSSTDQYKVANNINKWIKMLNNRDYQAAYNVLDETFRERFGGEEGFETYMRKAFPLHYEIEYGEFTKESGIYTQKITLTDITGESDSKIIKTILMDLREGTDFVMSFNTTRADVSR